MYIVYYRMYYTNVHNIYIILHKYIVQTIYNILYKSTQEHLTYTNYLKLDTAINSSSSDHWSRVCIDSLKKEVVPVAIKNLVDDK